MREPDPSHAPPTLRIGAAESAAPVGVPVLHGLGTLAAVAAADPRLPALFDELVEPTRSLAAGDARPSLEAAA